MRGMYAYEGDAFEALAGYYGYELHVAEEGHFVGK
jgi:hypothetical protein